MNTRRSLTARINYIPSGRRNPYLSNLYGTYLAGLGSGRLPNRHSTRKNIYGSSRPFLVQGMPDQTRVVHSLVGSEIQGQAATGPGSLDSSTPAPKYKLGNNASQITQELNERAKAAEPDAGFLHSPIQKISGRNEGSTFAQVGNVRVNDVKKRGNG
ncbi:hypothetical protein B0J17DRAFT_625927 [Rhizoctonia solani]|nr:hypothetical protein B0J17DRAFT_625927 [Rhizoctonia solani]